MAKAEKKSNIYKVRTHFDDTDGNKLASRIDFVRAKTKAGAKALIANECIQAELATTDDLLKLAGVAVKG